MMELKRTYHRLIAKSRNTLQSAGITDSTGVELLLLILYAKLKRNAIAHDVSNEKQIVEALQQVTAHLKEIANIDLTNLPDQLKPAILLELAAIWEPVEVSELTGISLDFWEETTDTFASNFKYGYNAFTPKEICDLIATSVDSSKARTVYDPACGSAGLLHTVANQLKSAQKVVGESRSKPEYQLAKMRELMQNEGSPLHIELAESNNLTDRNERFDLVVSNPPFGRWDNNFPVGNGRLTNLFRKTKRKEILFLAHAIDSINNRGQAAIIVPAGILFGSGVMQELRKELIEQDLLEAIVQLPAGVFYNTGVSAAILFFNKTKSSGETLFIDVSSEGKRDKFRTIIPDELGEKLATIINSFRTGELQLEPEGQSRIAVISQQQFVENDFMFQIQFYQESNPSPVPAFRDSQDILSECKSIEERLVDIRNQFISNNND